MKQYKYISDYYDYLVELTKEHYFVGTTNEWIIDNYYLVVEAKNMIKNLLKRDPETRKIVNENADLYNLIEGVFEKHHFDVDYKLLTKEINNYQNRSSYYFTYNSIKVIPILIIFVVQEKLHELSVIKRNKMIKRQKVRALVETIKSDKVEKANFDLSDYIDRDFLDHPEYLELLNNELKDLGDQSNEIFAELNAILDASGIELKEILKNEHDASIQNNILVANIFSSFKLIGKMTVADLIYKISKTEKLLQEESIYSKMTDETKTMYRHQIVKNTKKTDEYKYVEGLVKKSKKENKHIGFYLFPKANYKLRSTIYLATIIILTLLVSFFLSGYLFKSRIISFLLVLVPVSEVIIQLTNKVMARFFGTQPIPKMDFTKEIPKSEKTMIVIPTLLKDTKKVNQMFKNLEAYYLNIGTDNVYFSLVGDGKESNGPDDEFDDEIVNYGVAKAAELNKKYGKDLFFFVYRTRMYAEGEEKYLGYERKRGALMQFNKLLLNGYSKEEKAKYFFAETISNLKEKIKYVVTLDVDTGLGIDAVQKLVGLMAHPLNRPILNKEKTKVVGGFAIIQPRISVDIEATNKSPYSQLMAGVGGFDVYSTVVPNFYFDVFGEGSFVGKGIYDLEVFETVLGTAFPENQILSHDLIEGNYLRCGFASDIEFIEDFPSEFLVDTSRQHRWARGDVQVIEWIFNKVKSFGNKIVNNPLNAIERFKIFDNVRRQFLNVMLLLMILLSFTFYKISPIYPLLTTVMIILLPILLYLRDFLRLQNKKVFSFKYYDNLLFGNFAIMSRVLITFVTIPFYANHYMNAFAKSMYRMKVSRKRLLNWITAEDAAKTINNKLSTYFKAFEANIAVSAILIITAFFTKPAYLASIILLIILFAIAPWLLWFISQKYEEKTKLNTHEEEELSEMAYRTWLYFEHMLNERNNYLIPDNYQVGREEAEDMKTSPTDIGMSMMAILAAQEFDFIDVKDTLFYFDKILTTLEKLEKWNGHLYNWINIQTMEKMAPNYVSSVDSANLAAALLTVRSYLDEYDDALANRATKLFEAMNFKKFYTEQEVFSIGYDTVEEKLSPYNYNKFASESRIMSFVAIVKGDVDSKHWMCLDKTLTKHKRRKGLVSWGGTSFEYFMPLLFMKTYPNTLLDESYYFATYCQKDYMNEINPELPWGISESAYSELDNGENYKYKAFGTPYLKIIEDKRQRIVISPYASALAMQIEPKEVYDNLKKFKNMGMYGDYGFYESFDYDNNAKVAAYFAHHQGMILTSISNYIHGGAIQGYFHQDLRVKSFELLLKEKVQLNPVIDLKMFGYKKYNYEREKVENDIREFNYLSEVPEISVLSNGKYAMLINDRGNGFSRFETIQLNRYRKITEQDYGNFLYLKDKDLGRFWSNTYSPVNVEPEKYNVVFSTDRIKFTRYDYGITTKTEIVVTKENDAEIRKVTLKNHSDKAKNIELTTYSEAIIQDNIIDVTHRTFHNLFVKSYYDENTQTLLMRRKNNTKKESAYFINRIFIPGEEHSVSYETERANFIGRCANTDNPAAMHVEQLSNTVGDNIDPVMALRSQVTIEAGSEKTIYLIYGFSKSREKAQKIISDYDNETKIALAFSYATEANNINTKLLNITGPDIRNYNLMLNYLYQTSKHFVNDVRKDILTKNSLNQTNLWKFDITGDRPIILVEISESESLSFVLDMLKAYEYFKTRGIFIDVVIINREKDKYKPIIDRAIEQELYRIETLFDFGGTPGKVYVLDSDEVSTEEATLLRMVARISFNTETDNSFGESIEKMRAENKMLPFPERMIAHSKPAKIKKEGLEFYNEFGGFINDGKEYMVTDPHTPTPWSNVIANKNFGTIVTNNACGFTYAYNSQMFKVTSWTNDIVLNDKSEGIKIDGVLVDPSLARHGFGYSIFNNNTDEYSLNTTQFVSLDDTIKFYNCKIVNELKEAKKFTLTFWMNPTFGPNEEKSSRYLLSEYSEEMNSVLVRNVYNPEFSHITAFMTSTLPATDYSVERVIFKSITVELDLKPGEEKEFAFMLGTEVEHEDIRKLINKYSTVEKINSEYEKVKNFWKEKLGTIKVKTPDKSFDYIMNGWYLYQSIASRNYAKAGFYQVGGAFGYRDQLQDCTNTCLVDPLAAKEQIIRNANHQFREGDVLHWWHERNRFGLRSRYKDDYLWLVYAVSEYLRITEDYSILDEKIAFVTGAVLADGEEERGINFNYSKETSSLYTHCLLAINRALSNMGENGLPLMGGGDWNDGMNKVGIGGKGTSVWLGFFLHIVLERFIEFSKKYDAKKSVSSFEKEVQKLGKALNDVAWDGEYYLRAFFDNGNKLGSHENRECKIDLISQSFAVLSGVADRERSEKSIRAAEDNLVDNELKIVKLLTPPFKNTKDIPGYIMDYPEGVRENGGQYTHSVSWYILALIKVGAFDLAYKYFSMINPINRSLSKKDVEKYQVEPYVIAADIYSNTNNPARGGWTWYTGSAAWFYNVGISHILGLVKRGKKLYISPNIPSKWKEFEIEYKYMDTNYKIKVVVGSSEKMVVDGEEIKKREVSLKNDKRLHTVVVTIKGVK